jgi:hypothetical protein
MWVGSWRGRRAVNEAALDTTSNPHRMAPSFSAMISEEAQQLTDQSLRTGLLDSAQVMTAWWKIVRRLMFGNPDRDDEAVTNDLLRLRRAGN